MAPSLLNSNKQPFGSTRFKGKANIPPIATPSSRHIPFSRSRSIIHHDRSAIDNAMKKAFSDTAREWMHRPRRPVYNEQIDFRWKVGRCIPKTWPAITSFRKRRMMERGFKFMFSQPFFHFCNERQVLIVTV